MSDSGSRLARSPLAEVLVLGVGNFLVAMKGGGSCIRHLERETWPPMSAWLMVAREGSISSNFCAAMRRSSLSTPPATDRRPARLRSSARGLPPTSPALGAHDIGLRDLITAATMLGPCRRRLITVSIVELKPMTLELSPLVAAALPKSAAACAHSWLTGGARRFVGAQTIREMDRSGVG